MQHKHRIGTLGHLGRNNGARYVRINEVMLEEQLTFEEASKKVEGRNLGTQGMKTYSRSEIITENRINFDMVLKNKLMPYERVVEAMEAVTKDGRPDWGTQLNAVKLFAQMSGLDPRQGITVNIGDQTMNIGIGAVLNLTRHITDEDQLAQITHEIKQLERQGILRPEQITHNLPPIDNDRLDTANVIDAEVIDAESSG